MATRTRILALLATVLLFSVAGSGFALYTLMRADDELHRVASAPDWQVGPVIDLIDYRYQTGEPILAAGTAEPRAMGGLLGREVLRRFRHRVTTREVWDPTIKRGRKR